MTINSLHTTPHIEWIERIGHGTTGEVWHARYAGHDVAVKVFTNRPLWDQRALSRLQASTLSLKSLNHPFITQPLHYGLFTSREALPPIERELDAERFAQAFPHGCPYVVMEHLGMETLEAHAQRIHRAHNPSPLLEWPALLALTERLLHTLSYAHARGVIHTNLKPQNILLSHDFERLQLVDFGVVQDFDQSLKTASLRSLGVTPEHRTGQWRLLGPATDLYALASILWWLAGGDPLPLGTTRHPFAALPPLQAKAGTVPTAFGVWLTALTASHPRERPHSAPAALLLLHNLLQSAPPTPPLPKVIRDVFHKAISTQSTQVLLLSQADAEDARIALTEHTHARLLHTTLQPHPHDFSSLRDLLARHFNAHLATLDEATILTRTALFDTLTCPSPQDQLAQDDFDDLWAFSSPEYDTETLQAAVLSAWMSPALLSPKTHASPSQKQLLPRVSFQNPTDTHAALRGFLQSLLRDDTPLVLSLDNIHNSLDALSLIFYLLDPESALVGPSLLILSYDPSCVPISDLHREWLHALLQDPDVHPYARLCDQAKSSKSSHKTSLYDQFIGMVEGAWSEMAIALEIAALLGPDVQQDLWMRVCATCGVTPSPSFLHAWMSARFGVYTPRGWAFADPNIATHLREKARTMERLHTHAQACYDVCLAEASLPHDQYTLETLCFLAHQARHQSNELEHSLARIRLFHVQDQYTRCVPILQRCTSLLKHLNLTQQHPLVHEVALLHATNLLNTGRVQDALDHTRTHIAAMRGDPPTHMLSEMLLLLAQGSLLVADQGRAEGHLLEALLLAESLDAPVLMARAKSALGDLYCRRAESARASIEYEDACQLFAHVGKRSELAATRYALASALRILGETQRSEDAFEMALVSYEATGDRFNIACCLNALGELARATHDPVRAQHYYERALHELCAIHSPQSIRVNINLALLSLAQHHYTQAHARLQGALDSPDAQHLSSPEEIRIHAGLLACAAASGHWRTWDAHVVSLQTLLRQPTTHPDIARALDHAGALAAEYGQTHRAKPILEYAIQQWENLRNTRRADLLRTLLYPHPLDDTDVPF